MRIASIVWAESSRVAETLAHRLDAEFHVIRCERKRGFARLVQYVDLARATRTILEQSDPDVVVVQNPPIHAVSVVARHCRERRAALVIDAHTGAFASQGLLAGSYRRRFVRFAHDALVTLIHNEGLVPTAEELGIRYLVLEMAVPQPPEVEPEQFPGPAVAVVCGYGRDEPVAQVLAAAARLPEVTFHMTGRYPQSAYRQSPAAYRRNVVFTGFLVDNDYWRLLKGADVVLVLTTREATILSGAYEGLAVGKPLVLSRTETLARAFPKGAVLVDNRAEAIADGIRYALDSAEELKNRVAALAEEKRKTWEISFRALRQILESHK
jgi:glycosyltransferase involved in cell wall biosynthesis